MNGAAATIGLSTTINTLNGHILLTSVSPRNGSADNCNVDGEGVRGSACSVLVGNMGTSRIIVGAGFHGISLLPSSVGLTNTRIRVVNVSSHRDLLGGTLASI